VSSRRLWHICTRRLLAQCVVLNTAAAVWEPVWEGARPRRPQADTATSVGLACREDLQYSLGDEPICGQHVSRTAPRAVDRVQPSSLTEHWASRCPAAAQTFRVRSSDLSSGVYYIGVFNMDYFLHDAISYRLQVQRAAQHLCPAPLGAAPRPAARPCEACLAVPLCARMRRGGTLTGNIPGCSPPLYWQNVRAGMPRPACNPSALGL